MSSGGRSHTAPTSDRKPVSLPRLSEMKTNGEAIVMVTAYDYPSATVAEAAGVDVVLVGDSAANVVLGYPGTELVSMDEMVMLGKAVRRGLKSPLMVGDMPMGSYEASNEEAIRSAQRLIKETGCQAVKLEAGGVIVERARAIVQSGIPVMGHVGLTPQTATALGGYKAQGKSAKSAIKTLEDALALQSVGCFAIVIEAVPSAITDEIVKRLEVPTIGIGGGERGNHKGLVLPPPRVWGVARQRLSPPPPPHRPGSRLPRPAGDHHRPHGEIRQALRRHPRDDGRGGQALRPGGADAPLPRARTRLQRRAGRARRVPPLPQRGKLGQRQGLGVGAAPLSEGRAAQNRFQAAVELLLLVGAADLGFEFRARQRNQPAAR
jgi:3-methyl-2-oxobutanoate hydroxymethyltransferase